MLLLKKFSILSFLFFANGLLAELSVPRLSAPVVDQAGMLSRQSEQSLNSFLQDLRDKTQVQMAVLTVPSLRGDALESYSIRVVDEWQLGQADSDKGLLFLIAQKERKIRIEVGQGLEGDIPDAFAKRIIDHQMTPLMKGGNIEGGIVQGVLTAAKFAAPDYMKRLQGSQVQSLEEKTSRKKGGWSWLEVILIMAIIFFRMMFGGGFWFLGGGRSYRSGGFGGFGGGGFGGGGGGFSGGGASGGW